MEDANSWADKHVIIAQLAKAPEPGKVKTRMQPYLSAEQACDLHCALTESVAENITGADATSHALWVSSGAAFFKRIAQRFNMSVHQQCNGDLGARLAHISRYYFEQNDRQTGRPLLVMIGSDCPFLTAEHIRQCRTSLQSCDVVIIPATDGGYVCIAQKHYQATLFLNIDWGTDRVLQQTLMAAKQANLDVTLLAPLSDIDRPEDLDLLTGPKFNIYVQQQNLLK